MVFNYYYSLTKKQKSIYRQSDLVTEITLNRSEEFRDDIACLRLALSSENRTKTELAAGHIMDGLVLDLGVPKLGTRVLAVRPSNETSELHGLYEPAENGQRACITVWMRTAKHKRVVAFRTFLRTLLHEFCHHLDYELLSLKDSFHTEGFFKRESSLYKQLMD